MRNFHLYNGNVYKQYSGNWSVNNKIKSYEVIQLNIKKKNDFLKGVNSMLFRFTNFIVRTNTTTIGTLL